MLEIIQIPVLTDNYIYLLRDPVSEETAVVDPAEAHPVLAALQEKNWRLNYIFNTHHHAHHVGGNLQLKRHTECRIVGAKADRHRIPGIDIEVSHGDHIRLGDQDIGILATPGHTSGHIVYYFAAAGALFCGDTLFSLGCGRLFEGSPAQMRQSLQFLKALPASTLVYCAHEYTQANGRFALSLEPENQQLQLRVNEVDLLRSQHRSTLPSTIGQELATNPFFRESSAEIRARLGVGQEAADLEVFTRIRQMKDQFR